MKLNIIFVFFLMFSVTSENWTHFKNLQETENFDWMIGDWTRTNGRQELITTETWEKTSDGIYTGTGLIKKNNEMVFRENLRLLKKDGNWVYEVTGVNKDTTNFIIQSYSANSFVATNPENPFPKQIEYNYKEEKLIAIISDEDKKILFEFKRN